MNRKVVVSLLSLMFLFSVSSLMAANPIEIVLWPDGAPTKNGLENESEGTKPESPTKVSKAVLYVFPASKPNGTAVIACPGGGYTHLAMSHEGTAMADWMNRQGVTYCVLKYRMPNGHKEVPLEDAREAIRLVRERGAAEWGVNPSKVGIMGSSAGGHLASTLANMYGEKIYRPDFQILFYPVTAMQGDIHKGSRDALLGEEAKDADMTARYTMQNNVTPETPPAFITLSADDRVVPADNNGLAYAAALVRNKVPVTLCLYPTGGHGWGYRDSFKYKREWTSELEKFLSEIK